MHLIAYVSRSTKGELLHRGEIHAIARRSQVNNRGRGITGTLIFESGRYFQVLEGPELALRTVVQRIKRDPRHKELRVILDTPVAERAFPETPMQTYFVNLPELLSLPTIGMLDAIYTSTATLDAERLQASVRRMTEDMAHFHVLARDAPDRVEASASRNLPA